MTIIPKNNITLSLLILSIPLMSAVIAWWKIPEPNKAGNIEAEQNRWQLSAIKNSQQGDLFFSSINKRFIWGEKDEQNTNQIKTDNAKEKKINWFLKGVVVEGQYHYALIHEEGKSVNRYKTGDSLPDDSILLSVTDNSITISVNSETKKLALHKSNF